MQSVSTIISKTGLLVLGLFVSVTIAFSQENSPYSRYGLGDVIYSQSTTTRGMGGFSVAYSDPQTINFSNPASFASARIVTFDLGVSIDSRGLKSKTPVSKYTSNNFSPAYVALATPISAKRGIGVAFGFRPISKINYSVIKNERTSIDSMQTVYEGSGGFNEAFFGLGKRWKNLSAGFSTGYRFGRKETSTKRTFINDTVAYAVADYTNTTTFSGAFFNAGLQYDILLDSFHSTKTKMTERSYLRIGATANFGQTLNGSQDYKIQTIQYDYSGNMLMVDSIRSGTSVKGKIKVPATYTFGFMYQKVASDYTGLYDHWGIGAEFSTTQWSKYSFYDQKDATINSWQVRVGAQWIPDAKSVSSYYSKVNYKAGFNFGKDYINADGKELKTYGISFGAGLPIRTTRMSYQFTTIQTAIEFGKRGSSVNNVTENYFKLSVGFSLSDLWFIKRKYD